MIRLICWLLGHDWTYRFDYRLELYWGRECERCHKVQWRHEFMGVKP